MSAINYEGEDFTEDFENQIDYKSLKDSNMKVLMFGWEFPPNISGGLGTACYGLTKSLSAIEGMNITFVIPKVYGNENKKKIELLGANQIELIKSKIRLEKLMLPVDCFSVESLIVPYVDPREYKEQSSFTVEKIRSKATKETSTAVRFTGNYGPDLLTEIHNFSVVSEYIASQKEFDLIHAHDWLTFPAGIAAKKKTGKPLVIHVHATDFDRSGGAINPAVYNIEKHGMDQADCIVCVSNKTRETVINKYNIAPDKVFTVHNGVDFSNTNNSTIHTPKSGEKIVTFLGRITIQKGPEYFVQLAELILARMKNVKFIMAGSGELMNDMVKKVAQAGISDRFLFTGFLKGKDVHEMLSLSDVFVMPSVSEPFGICPLEAMQCGVPTIISKQSGVSEVVKHAIKVDYWDVKAMADAIHGILSYPALNTMMTQKGLSEAYTIKWGNAAKKIQCIYDNLVRA